MRPDIPFDRAIDRQPAAQRARGRAHLAVKCRGPRSVIGDLHMAGSSKLLFPRSLGELRPLDAVILNSAGGVTGGDDFSLSFALASESRLRVTTQAAERIYRAPSENPPGRVATQLTLASGAMLHWLPQETILFDGGALSRSLSVDLASDARFLGCETLVFGRRAMNEQVRSLRLDDRIDLRRDGKLIFADRLKLRGDAQADLERTFVADGFGAMASVLLAAPEAESRVDALRALLPASAGVSLPHRDLVFLRILAEDAFALRQTLVPLLTQLADGALPRPWML